MSRIRGLELLYNLVKDKIKSKQDCVVAALHCLLINENLQCVGTGETFSEDDATRTTELLPEGWNDNQEVYTIRYTSKNAKNRYLIKVVKAGNIMHVNIVLNEDKTAAMSVNIDKHVSDSFSEYSSAYNDLDSLKVSFQRDILQKMLAPSPARPSATNAGGSRPSAQRPVDSSRPPRGGPASGPRPVSPDFGYDNPSPLFGGGMLGQPAFPQVGGSDLDPLGRGQGGMLLDPTSFGNRRGPYGPGFGGGGSPHGLPRGAVPPGARFDPFGPPRRGPNRFEPDPDHFKPPDFDDFM